MRIIVVVAFIALVLVFAYGAFGSGSVHTYLFDRFPHMISSMFSSGEITKEEKNMRGGNEEPIGGNIAPIPEKDIGNISEEVRLQQSIRSVEEEIRRTEEFLQKKEVH